MLADIKQYITAALFQFVKVLFDEGVFELRDNHFLLFKVFHITFR